MVILQLCESSRKVVSCCFSQCGMYVWHSWGHGTAHHGEKSISWKWVIRVDGDDNDADALPISIYLQALMHRIIVFIGYINMKCICFTVDFKNL